jgi:serine/threonine-protein kinase
VTGGRTQADWAPGLTARVFASTILIVAVVVGVAFVIGRTTLRRAADQADRRALEQSADLAAQLLAGRLRTLAGGTRVFVQQPYFRTLVAEKRREDLLDQAGEAAEQVDALWVMITDGEGVKLAKSDERRLVPDSLGNVPLVAGALRGAQVTGFGVSHDTLLTQAVGVPVELPRRGPVGALVATKVVDSAFVADVRAATSSEVVAFVRDRTGDLRVAASTLGRGEPVVAMAEGLAQAGMPRDGAPVPVTLGQRAYLAHLGALTTAAGDAVGGLILLRAREGGEAVVEGITRSLVLATAAGLLLTLALAYLVAQRLTRPLRTLAATVRRANEGAFDAPLGSAALRGDAEVAALADALDELLGELRDAAALAATLKGARRSVARTTPREGVLRLVPAGGADPMEGAVLAGRYELEGEIGRGGLGIVHRATDRVLGEVVALKRLRPEVLRADPDGLARLVRELKAARQVTHRHVVRVHDVGEDQGLAFLTMELVNGPSLAQVIQGGPLPTEAVLSLAKQLFRALVASHDQGVVHGDLKPQNALVTEAGVLKVTDFGVAQQVRTLLEGAAQAPASAAVAGSVRGAAVGTPAFMAPERLLGGCATVASDLYSAGVLLQACLTGEQPAPADTPISTVARALQPAAHRATPTVGAVTGLRGVIASLMRSQPEDRPPSARDVLAQLEALG